MPGFNEDDLDRVREQADGARVAILLHVKLKRGSGTSRTGRCPLPGHEDKKSSFTAYEGGGWNCRGCGASGGDGISLYQAATGKDFVTTIKELARRFSIHLRQDNGAAVVGAELSEELLSLVAEHGTVEGAGEGGNVLGAAADYFMKRAAAYQETGKPVTGIPTGLRQVDADLGGLEAGLYILGALPGVGKTTLARQICFAAADLGYPAVYLAFVDSAVNLAVSAICSRAGLNTRDVRRGTVDIERFSATAEEMREAFGRVRIIEGGPESSLDQLESEIAAAKAAAGSDSCVVILDYLQLWAKTARAFGGLGDTRAKVETLVGSLPGLAVRSGAAILALSSLRRHGDGSENRKPTMQSLKESSDLEHAADVVFLLSKSEEESASAAAGVDLLVLEVAKNRHGPSGRKVDLVVDRVRGGLIREVDSRHVGL